MKATIFALAVFVHCVVSQFNYVTIPDTADGPAYIFADEGAVNVTVFCQEFDSDTGNRLITPWEVRLASDSAFDAIDFDDDGMPTDPDAVLGDITVTGDVVLTLTYQSNLTIIDFTDEYNRAMFRCGATASNDRRIFEFGFPILPSVADVGTQQQTEGSSFTVDLAVSGANDPFPPTITSQWYFNGVAIDDDSDDGVTLMDYSITFTDAMRDRSGNYTLTVSNDAGANTSSFILDIQYAPEATPVGGAFVKSPGSTFTLIAFTSIIGNPQPSSSWTGPSGAIVTGGRLNASVPGQLTISDAMSSDNGTYTCTISNGIDDDLTQTVELTIAVRPGPPRNVTATNITDISVVLSWEVPLQLGIPALSIYRVMITPSLSPDVVLNTTDTSLYLEDQLIPGTIYNVTVVGVSTEGDNFNMLTGEQSDILTFETDTGAPDIETAVLTISNTVVVSWSLRHNGGLEIDVVTIDCTNDIGTTVPCIDDSCDSDSVTVSQTVLAGLEYVCNITAFNENGTDSVLTNAITPQEGIPSVPMIVSTDVVTGGIVLGLRTANSGTSGTFTFSVNVTDVADGSTRVYNFQYDDYIDGSTVQAPITSLSDGGQFIFTVVSRNEFGDSVDSAISDTIDIPAGMSTSSIIISTSTTSTTATMTPTGTSTVAGSEGGLSGGAIGGIIVAIIALIALVVLVTIIVAYLYYKNRGGTYQVERAVGGKAGVKVEELDIDIGTELQDKSTEEKYTDTPAKPELHYADLEHFSKKEKHTEEVEPMTKPTPIEEVQYAQIQGNKQ